ncbi:ABC transporter permease subunit [Infirmifilum lucidum]|uniref:ABC transporter permease subunit n=1 Tax=Infirmifilum lucidum TaxID=2776706 RepID=A0A7L9FID0_9CREN|nr:ABC transporter permease subunit [Infirmifilum lucidum]QOJ79122.1 ABC transporter permease subunit [Infirmifilum lucidum]
MARYWGGFVASILLTTLSALIVFIMLYPVLYAVLTSLVRGQIIITDPSQILATGISLEHYSKAVSDPRFVNAAILSLLVAIINIVFALSVITPAAYAFSRFKFPGRDLVLVAYLVLSQVGGGFGVAAVIALYIMLIKLNQVGVPVIGNPVVLAAVYTAGAVPFQTWMVKNYLDALPREIDESAFIDGASWRQVIFDVVLPASKPTMVVIALFAFMGAWGEFIIANFLRIETLAAYVYETATGQTIFWSDFAARTILFAIPIIAVYVFTQKYIGEAMRYGAGKL